LHYGFFCNIFTPYGYFSNFHYYNINKLVKLAMCTRVIILDYIRVARESMYIDQKRPITYSPNAESGNASFRVTHVIIWAAIQRRLIFFLIPFFSLFHASIYVQSFDKFNCVLQFVFVLGLTFILLTLFLLDLILFYVCFVFNFIINRSFNLIRFCYLIWFFFFWLLFFYPFHYYYYYYYYYCYYVLGSLI